MNNMKEALISNGIFYCFIDDFYAGDGMEIKTDALLREYQRQLKASLEVNIKDILESVLVKTRIDMSFDEKETFLEKYIERKVEIEIDNTGNVALKLKKQ